MCLVTITWLPVICEMVLLKSVYETVANVTSFLTTLFGHAGFCKTFTACYFVLCL